MTYTARTALGIVTRDADGLQVSPCQSVNDVAFMEYLDWINQGNHPAVDDTMPPQVPAQVTRRQMLTALHRVGLLTSIQAAIDASGDFELRLAFDEALEFERGNPMLASMAAALGKTEADLDAIFILAATI
jgi:hypothetical protein